MLPGFMGNMMMAAGEDQTRKFEYVTSARNASVGSTSVTFSGVSLGDPHSTRLVVIAVSHFHGSNSVAPTSLTVGGVPATLVVNAATGSGSCAIFAAEVPAGDVGDVVATFSNTVTSVTVGIWRGQNLNSNTAVGSNGSRSQTGNKTVTINAPAEGFVVGVAGSKSGSATFSWVGTVTERYDLGAGSGADRTTTASGSVTVNYTSSSSDINAIAAASWG
jgi:hypothetical protein